MSTALREYLLSLKVPVQFPLPSKWPCADFDLKQWAELLPERLEFRHEPVAAAPQYEVEQTHRFHATLAEFAEAVRKGRFDRPSIDLASQWVYSSYNWMSTLKVTQKDCLNWAFFDTNEVDCSSTTIWFGTNGAFTPCHRDSYGVNIVAQLIGSKEWLLFAPEDEPSLYASRLPYEETSVFSTIDFSRQPVNLTKYPLLGKATPYRVVLEPGQVLFVPKHWWHFVRCVAPVCVSVNRWFEVDSDAADKIDEALTALLVDRIGDLVDGSVPAFNDEKETEHDPDVVLEAIRRASRDLNTGPARHCTQRAKSEDRLEPSKQNQQHSGSSADRTSEQDLGQHFGVTMVKKVALETIVTPHSAACDDSKTDGRREVCMNDIVESILDPDVIRCIRHNILQRIGQ